MPMRIHTIQRTKLHKENAPIDWESTGLKRIPNADELWKLIFKKLKPSKDLGIDDEVEINSIMQTKWLNSKIANSSSKNKMSRHSTSIKVKGVIRKKFLCEVN